MVMKLTMPLISRWNVFGPFFLTKKALSNKYVWTAFGKLAYFFKFFVKLCEEKIFMYNVFCKRSVENQWD